MKLKEKQSIIFLTGFMGSGKSTVGPILANTIGFQFIDLDVLIETKEKKRISDIFAAEGEQMFRFLERETLKEILQHKSTIVSLGGGTVTNDESLELVKLHGVLVYLKSDIEHIFQRLRTKSDRPMLRDEDGKLLDGEGLRKKIENLLTAREHYYLQADIVISTDDKKIGYTIDELAKKLAHYID
ncbi:MAG: shikimate kinase [Bacteriovoracaceae bacterium]|nr:shikimate kinase [Bacteroidota bacterium]